MARTATLHRKTTETDVKLELNLDGQGIGTIGTGVGFLDHMLELFRRHACFDLEIAALGDLHVDQHHTVEDVGICLGQALRTALGDKQGIRRYGHAVIPMDETLVTAAVDLSGRSFLVYQVGFPTPQIGPFDTELVREFCQAIAFHGQLNLHLLLHHGGNSHHIAEAVFKAMARSLRTAVESDPRQVGVPSTKGTLG
jgi:imidazoleglycerol-phosphate dehydratase